MHQGHGVAQLGETSFDVYAGADAAHLLVLRQTETGQSLLYRMSSRGKITSESEIPLIAGEKVVSRRSNDVQLAVAGRHMLAAWQVSGTGFAHRGPLRFAESKDGGATWIATNGPTAPTRTDDQGFLDLVADKSGRFHAAWLDVAGKSKGLRYAQFQASAWSEVMPIDSATCQCCWNSMRLNYRDDVLVLYRAAAPRDMALATLRRGSWKAREIVDGFSWHINACPHAGGGISAAGPNYTYAVTWTGAENATGTYLNRRENQKGTWNFRRKFGNASARNPDVAESGERVAVTWDEFEGGERLVKVMVSEDSGQTFSPPQTLSSRGAVASYPRIVYSANAFEVFWSESIENNLRTRSARL